MSAQRYRLLGLLSRGGMGLLYRAWDTKLDRPVAVKMLANRLDVDAHGRAILEAKATTRVRSDHVVQVYDAGQIDESGCPYLVMELLVGEDLQAVIRRGPVPSATAVDWILQACEALAHLDLHGLVHRDIKPANLFLENRIDGTLRLKLVDFGVAKDIGDDLSRSAGLTNDGELIGSIPYLSPEQVVDSRDVDARADVWGLGTVLYELLSGEPAFEAHQRADAMAQITQQQHTPLHALQSHIPRGLSEVVDRCLEKRRDRRWPDITELARALAPFASEQGAGLVARVCAIRKAELPMGPSGRGSSPALPALSSAPGSEILLADPENSVDWGSLREGAEFVATVPSAAASEVPPSEVRRWPRRLLSSLGGAGLAGPVLVALAMVAVAAWSRTTLFATPLFATPLLATTRDVQTQHLGPDCQGSFVYYPANEMAHKTGNARGPDWNLFTNGSVSQLHEFASGEAELRVTAAGDLAGEELPHMIVSVGHHVIGEADVTSRDFSTYAFPYAAPGGEQVIKISFSNDYLDDGEDRNLILRDLGVGQCL